jgi:hypothetical protein
MTVDRFPLAQAHIKGILDVYWAHLCALTTARADLFINVTGFLADMNIKISNITGNRIHLAVNQQLNILMASNGHHFWS